MNPTDPAFDAPEAFVPVEDPDDPNDLDKYGPSIDDDCWDAFIPDDDERDPLPDPGDFWGSEESD
jgi:hypothetical protein